MNVGEMQKSRFTTLDKAIQGRSSGVYISQTSGKPGVTASVKIRGIGSINRTSEPLYIIDGIASEYDDILNSINPADVESIQVLKDASAQAIYGARAANGVIIINTKKSKTGKPVVNFSADYGLSTIARYYDVMNADQYSEFMGMAWTNYATRRNIPDAQNLYLTVYSKEAREAQWVEYGRRMNMSPNSQILKYFVKRFEENKRNILFPDSSQLIYKKEWKYAIENLIDELKTEINLHLQEKTSSVDN